LKDAVLATLRLIARVWPRAAVLVAHALAILTRPLGHGIADASLADAFPGISPADRRAARQRTWESFLKGEAVEAAIRRRGGSRAYPRVLPSPALAELRPPLVLASFHVGPYQALGGAMRTLPADVVSIDRGQYALSSDMTLLRGGEDEWQRAHTFHRTLSALRSGRFVLVTVDAFHPDEYAVAKIEVPLLGRTLPLARGAFALARISRTPIVPIVVRWRGTAMEVTVGDPIGPEAGEAGMAAATAGWLERYLLERPGEISVFMLDRLRPPPGR
jgi:lauroyl/myristoyl acyltransferase